MMKRAETIPALVAHGVITCGSILFFVFYRCFDWRILEASKKVFPEITEEKYSVLQHMVLGNTWLIATPLIVGALFLLGALRWPMLGSRVAVALNGLLLSFVLFLYLFAVATWIILMSPMSLCGSGAT